MNLQLCCERRSLQSENKKDQKNKNSFPLSVSVSIRIVVYIRGSQWDRKRAKTLTVSRNIRKKLTVSRNNRNEKLVVMAFSGVLNNEINF